MLLNDVASGLNSPSCSTPTSTLGTPTGFRPRRMLKLFGRSLKRGICRSSGTTPPHVRSRKDIG